MNVLYEVDGDELVLDIDHHRVDRKQTWKRLKGLGAPITLEPTVATVLARVPVEGVDELKSALTMIGAGLEPKPGQPPLDDLGGSTQRYEDVRPVDPEAVVELARPDEQPRPILRRAIADLGTFAAEHPGFEHRVEADKRYLRRALERFAPDKKGEDGDGDPDPVKQAVSRTLRSVPDEDKWRARELLLDLHEVTSRTQGERPMADVPDPIPGFKGKLRDYQVEGVGFLLGTGLNAILADEMGLGKTVTTIAALLAADAVEDASEPTRALVVAPANVLYNWAAEVRRFTGEQPAIWHGRTLDGPADARFRITTYASLRYRDWRETDADQRPVLVLDEAHKVRNPETQRARLIDELPQQHRILLTGTPVVNGLEDVNELLTQVGEETWAEGSAFQETWLTDPKLLHRQPKVRAAVADLLQQATQHVLLRRRKEDVLEDLPPRTVSVIPHVLGEEDRRAYDALERHAHEVMAETESEVKVFAQLHKLRQFLIERRIGLLTERIENLLAEGEPCVVYSHYLDPLEQLAERLGDAAAELTGSTPPVKRERLARELGEPEGPMVLLAQIKAGGLGINLTGARNVIFCHLGWTAAIHRQAIDRVHRIGQDEPVQVDFVVSPDTIDERLADIILRKEADANLALADEGDVLNRSELARVLLDP